MTGSERSKVPAKARRGYLDLFEPELQGIVKHQKWLLGTCSLEDQEAVSTAVLSAPVLNVVKHILSVLADTLV